MKKRLLSIFLAFVMIFSMIGFAFAAGAEDFSDVKAGQWYYEYVDDVAELGYFVGYPDGTFRPGNDITRAEVVLVLARMAQRLGLAKGINLDAPIAEAPFEDVSTNQWYSAAVKWAADEEITLGMGNNKFAPRNPVTREDACTLICRFMNYVGEHLGTYYTKHYNASLIYEFEDEALIRDYAAEAVDVCMAYGLVEGFTDHSFQPRSNWTRAQGAKMISILHDVLDVPDEPYIPGYENHVGTLTYHVDGKTDVVPGETQTVTVLAGQTPNFTWSITNVVVYDADGDGVADYNILGWDTDPAATNPFFKYGNGISTANPNVDLYAVLEPITGDVTYVSKLVYVVDGKEDVITVAPQTTTVPAGTDVSEMSVEWTVTDVATYTNDNGVEYAILGWDKASAASNVDRKAGDTFGAAVGSTVKLYAVLVPMDDYIKMAVLGAIEDANAYAAKAEDLTVTAGSYDVTVGDYVTADEITLDINTNTVKVAVTGELNSSTVVDVIALATEYAVAILGPDEDLPTVDEIKDIVIDIADSVGVKLEGQTAKEIAKQVYDKVDAIGTDLFSNFRNYNSGFCINKITLKSGDKAVASLNVTNDKGLTTDGAEASKAAAKELAIAVAKAMYADLRTQSGSNITLKASIVVEFAPNYVSTYNDTYTLDLAVTVKSDMYRYDGATNTLTLIINKELQEQYETSLEQVVTATLENGTVQAKLTEEIEKALEKSGLLDSLSSLAAKDAVKAAMDLWIAANLEAEAAGDIDTPYEFLWTKEGTISLVNGTYVTSTGTVLGDNAALYALVETVYADKLNEVINGIDASMVSGGLLNSIKTLLKPEDVDAAVAAALAEWKAANGKNATEAYALYNFLFNGGKVIDNGDGTYSLSTGTQLGVNDALYEMVIDLCADLAVVVADTALTEAAAKIEAMNPGYWSNMDSKTKLGLIAAAVKTELQDAGITGDFYNYLTNLCLAEAAADLDLPYEEYLEAADSSCVAPMIDDMLVKGLYNAVSGNEYADYVGLDQAGREDMVDQMILKALATTTVNDKTLGEYLAKAYQVKTIQRMANLRLENVATLLNNATFQDVAAKYGNEYIHYLATAITKLPAKASVTVENVVISAAELEGVKTAAANNDTKAVCTELAEIISKLGHLTMNELESNPLTITVKYGNRSATVNFALDIED